MSSRTSYFANIDSIRFIAAIGVVFAHGFGPLKVYFLHEHWFLKQSYFPYIDRFFNNLGIGVEIFFFISGFLITYLLLKEKQRFGKISIWKFIIRRTLRIWPLYFLLVLIGPFLVNWLEFQHPNYLPVIFFYSNYDIIHVREWQYPFAHYWSLAIEEQFYFIWPFILQVFGFVSLKTVMIFLIFISLFSRGYLFYYSDAKWLDLYLNTLCRMDTIIIGALLAYSYFKTSFSIILPKSLRFLLIIGSISSLFFYSYVEWLTIWEAVFLKYIYLLVFGVLIMHYICNEPVKQGRLFKLLSYLGKISFGIYIFHNIFLQIALHKIILNNEINSALAYIAIYLGGIIIIAVVSYEFYEKPFLRLKKRFSPSEVNHLKNKFIGT
jgi:peptidoglycan/LPS O-acetylase OafA/YrhL